jgi:hypothetical protein
VKPSDAGEVIATKPSGETLSADPLESALAAAAAAGQWSVLSQLATELQARRLEAAGVATLPARAKG